MALVLTAMCVPFRARHLVAATVLAVLAVASDQGRAVTIAADQPSALSRARIAYNQRRYDEAIAAAREAERIPETATPALLLVARASLERYRQSSAASDLATARSTMASIDPAKLSPGDRGEMQVGLGELLYFDDRFGAAADMFEDAMSRVGDRGYTPRERLLGWYATSLDRQARLEAPSGRRRIYRRLLERVARENRVGSGSAVASYWVVTATFGADDVEDAWDAAVATWVRAPLIPGGGVTLRDDIDRFVLTAIIPRRAKLASAGGETEPAADAFRKDWASVKLTWPHR